MKNIVNLSGVILLSALLIISASCKKTNTETIAEDYDYSKILAGDFSDFAGTWRNNYGVLTELRADGVFLWVEEKMKVYEIEQMKQQASGKTYYRWLNAGENFGFIMALFPAGVEIIRDSGDICESDTSKTRIYAYSSDLYYDSNVVYYFYSKPADTPQSKTSSIEPAELSLAKEYNSETRAWQPVPQNGYINANEELWYSVRTQSEGLITVIARGFNIDTFLCAYNHDYDIIAQNDDWEGYDPRIQIRAEANKTYYFKLAVIGGLNGSFRIMASFIAMSEIKPLFSGSETGIIESGQEYWYSVRVSGTGILNTYTTGNTDTILEAYNNNFENIFIDDDSGDNFNARIKISVRSGQIFYFKVRSGSGVSGPYGIITKVEAYPSPVILSPGSFMDAHINEGDEHWYSVTMTEGDILTVETTGSTDTYITAYNSDYEEFDSNDDNEDYNAKIRIWIQNERMFTTYIFKLKSFNSGSYRIHANINYSL